MKSNLFIISMNILIISGQKITTIQLDGVQYFISRMNPYSPELNYFLAYQYCRSLGLQLVSFESREEAETMIQYLKSAGYSKYEFWTSGNNLVTNQFFWMSTGQQFNATFNYMINATKRGSGDVPPGTVLERGGAHESNDSGSIHGCVAMTSPSLLWGVLNCTFIRDFICEQTRCYNYGSIPLSSARGKRMPDMETLTSNNIIPTINSTTTSKMIPILTKLEVSNGNINNIRMTFEDSMKELSLHNHLNNNQVNFRNAIEKKPMLPNLTNKLHPEFSTDITNLFPKKPFPKDSILSNSETYENHPNSRQQKAGSPNHAFEVSTIGPYDVVGDDYQADQAETTSLKQEPSFIISDDDSSTTFPEVEPLKYNIKVRNNGKVLDHIPN